MRFAHTLAMLATVAAVPVQAAPCGSTFCPPVVNHVVATPVVTALPLYGAGYSGYGAGADDETKELLRSLIREVQAMRSDLQAAQTGPPPGAMAAPKGPDVFAVFRASCVSCHGGDKPKGEFSLLDSKGQFRPLSPPERRSLVARIDGKGGSIMPPAREGHKPLTAAEKAAIKAALSDPAPTGPVPAIPAGK